MKHGSFNSTDYWELYVVHYSVPYSMNATGGRITLFL